METQSYGQFCPVAMAAEILCNRWTMVILRELVVGSTRFNELRKGVPRMSPALLSKRLKELEEAGVIEHVPSAEAGVFEYRLTEAGRDLRSVVEAVGIWGSVGPIRTQPAESRSQPLDVGHAAQPRPDPHA